MPLFTRTPKGVPYSTIWSAALKSCGARGVAGARLDNPSDLGLNPSYVTELCRDKAASKAMLEQLGFKVVPAVPFSVPGKQDGGRESGLPQVLEAAGTFGFPTRPVVLKPTHGLGGEAVHRVQTLEQLWGAMTEIKQLGQGGVVSPLLKPRCEWRVIVDTNPGSGWPEVVLVLQKNVLTVIGDGKHTVLDLLLQAPLREEVRAQALAQASSYLQDRLYQVLPVGEPLECHWKHSKNTGTSFSRVGGASVVAQRATLTALRVAADLQLRFGAVDLLEMPDGSLPVLELNTLVAADLVDWLSQEELTVWLKRQIAALDHLRGSGPQPLCNTPTKDILLRQDWGENLEEAVSLTSDKVETSRALVEAGVPCLEHAALEAETFYEQIGEKLAHDGAVVLKTRYGSSGARALRCSSWLEAERAISMHADVTRFCVCPSLDVQEEHRVIVVGGKAMQIHKKVFLDAPRKLAEKPGLAMQEASFQVPPELASLAERAAAVVHLSGGAVDVVTMPQGPIVTGIDGTIEFGSLKNTLVDACLDRAVL